MRSRKLILVLVLGIATLGAHAASAQALEAQWTIAGESLAELTLKEEKVSSAGEKSMSLSIPGLKATVECKKASTSGKIFESGTDELTTTYTSCEVVKNAACKVSEPMVMETKFKVIEVGGQYYDELEALKEGKPLTTVLITGKECTLPAESKLTGAVVADTPPEEAKEEPLLFSEAISNTVNKALKEESKAELKLSFGTQAAYLSGESIEALSGANAGKEWDLVVRTKLCPNNENACAAGTNYGSGTVLKFENAEVNVLFRYSLSGVEKEVSCNVSKMEGKTTFGVGSPLLNGIFTTLTFQECAGGVCSVTAATSAYKIQFGTTGLGDGLMTMRFPQFKVVCFGKTCVYGAWILRFSVEGGPFAYAYAPRLPIGKETGDAACSAFGTMEGVGTINKELKYRFLAPSGMYLTE